MVASTRGSGEQADTHLSSPELRVLRERIVAANAARTPLRLRGGGTKDFYGNASKGEVLDTSAYRGIVAYEPSELVVTARCGTPLSEVQAALAGRSQWLAFEPPVFGGDASRTTLGGVVAAGLSGPGRATYGAVRDFVLGAALIDARGRALNFGGRVMKNVAGYDVSRLLCGSMGVLGLIAEVSLKVLPRPPAVVSVGMHMPVDEAVAWLNQWGALPLPISASAWMGDTLCLRLSGAAPAVHAARDRFVREVGAGVLDAANASALWNGLRDHSLPFFGAGEHGGAPLWRLSVRSTAAPIALPGVQLVEWGGALRWWRTDAPAEMVRASAHAAGGHATRFRAGAAAAPDAAGNVGASSAAPSVFDALSPAALAIHRRLKLEFDPNGIFNPDRLVPGL